MQDLLLGPLLTNWAPPALAYVKQYPWQVFAAVLIVVLLIHMLLSKRDSSTGDFPELDGFGGGDADCGGD